MEYNYKYNEKIVEKFKKEQLKPEDVTIYFDMDNTLCLFCIYGKSEEAIRDMYSQGFYRNLKCFPEARFVIETLQHIGFKVKIISSCVETPFVKIEKFEWVRYHLPSIKEEDIILIPEGTPKSAYVSDISHSIIVDDFGPNVQGFYDGGGIGIKKTYSGKKRPVLQICNLIEIFGVLYDLNCLN